LVRRYARQYAFLRSTLGMPLHAPVPRTPLTNDERRSQ
jgi:hypothetical protein